MLCPNEILGFLTGVIFMSFKQIPKAFILVQIVTKFIAVAFALDATMEILGP